MRSITQYEVDLPVGMSTTSSAMTGGGRETKENEGAAAAMGKTFQVGGFGR